MELTEASPQQSTMNGACGAGASIAVSVQPLRSWCHNALRLTNGAEHRQQKLMLTELNNALLQQININGN